MNKNNVAYIAKEILARLSEDILIDNDRSSSLRDEKINNFLSIFMSDEERADLYSLPKGCRIREGAKIIDRSNLTIGEYCWIGENAVLDASGGLEIGSHTSIGLGVYVWTHSSAVANLKMQNTAASDLRKRKPTKIGSGCFISGPAVIMPGSVIGDKVLIAPFTTVDGVIEDGSRVGFDK